MHFALTYDLSAQGARRNEIESRIEEILNPYVHVKRLTTFYIIHVNDNIREFNKQVQNYEMFL